MDGLWLFYPLYYVSQYVISGCMPGMHCVNPKKPDLQTPSCQGFPLGPAGLVEHLAMRSMASMMSACGNMAMPILGSSQLRDLRFLDLRANEPNAMGNSQFSFSMGGKIIYRMFLLWPNIFFGTTPMNRRQRKKVLHRGLWLPDIDRHRLDLGRHLGHPEGIQLQSFRHCPTCRNLPGSAGFR